jgi:2-amino-4-hydroxy-6-hydroxymethyldihydropteridine diphosphokinase
VIRYFVGLGSNLGDRVATVCEAIEQLAALPDVSLRGRSAIWETRPLGPGTHAFVNAAVEIASELEPPALLRRLLEIEAAHGRVRRERWGDRTLDLDLLCGFVDGRELQWSDDSLSLPHPGLTSRDFVLQPLLELDAELVVAGRRVDAWLAALTDERRTLLRRVG